MAETQVPKPDEEEQIINIQVEQGKDEQIQEVKEDQIFSFKCGNALRLQRELEEEKAEKGDELVPTPEGYVLVQECDEKDFPKFHRPNCDKVVFNKANLLVSSIRVEFG